MSSDQSPPRRPGRYRIEVLLIVMAMLFVAVLGFAPAIWKKPGWRWFSGLFGGDEEWVMYGLPIVTLALLGCALVAISRRR